MKVVILPGGGGTPSTMTFIDDGPGHNCRCATGVSKIENNLGWRRDPYAEVKDIVSADFRTKAKRPSNSCLSTEKIRQGFRLAGPKLAVECEHCRPACHRYGLPWLSVESAREAKGLSDP
jgi:hypothetical protein